MKQVHKLIHKMTVELPVLQCVSPLLGSALAKKYKHLTGDRWAQRSLLKSYWDHLDGGEVSAFPPQC